MAQDLPYVWLCLCSHLSLKLDNSQLEKQGQGGGFVEAADKGGKIKFTFEVEINEPEWSS